MTKRVAQLGPSGGPLSGSPPLHLHTLDHFTDRSFGAVRRYLTADEKAHKNGSLKTKRKSLGDMVRSSLSNVSLKPCKLFGKPVLLDPVSIVSVKSEVVAEEVSPSEPQEDSSVCEKVSDGVYSQEFYDELGRAGLRWRKCEDGRIHVVMRGQLDFVPLECAMKNKQVDLASCLAVKPENGWMLVYFHFHKTLIKRSGPSGRLGLPDTRDFLKTILSAAGVDAGQVCEMKHEELAAYMCRVEALRMYTQNPFVCLFPANTPRYIRQGLDAGDLDDILPVLVSEIAEFSGIVRDAIRRRCRHYLQKPVFDAICSVYAEHLGRRLAWKDNHIYSVERRKRYKTLSGAVEDGGFDAIIPEIRFLHMLPERARHCAALRCENLGLTTSGELLDKIDTNLHPARWKIPKRTRKRRACGKILQGRRKRRAAQTQPRPPAPVQSESKSKSQSQSERQHHSQSQSQSPPRKQDALVPHRPDSVGLSKHEAVGSPPRQKKERRVREEEGLLDGVEEYLEDEEVEKVDIIRAAFEAREEKFYKAATIAPVYERYQILSHHECEDFALACGWFKRDVLHKVKRRLGRKRRHIYHSVVRLAWLLHVARKNSLNVTLFSGAGISTGKGANLPTVRGSTKASPSAEFSAEALEQISPTLSHMVIKGLMDEGFLHFVCTQNIEGLHKASGLDPSKVWEVHGSLFEFACTKCGEIYDESNPPPSPVMVCPKCNPSSNSVSFMRHEKFFTRHSGLLRRRVIRHYGEAVHPPPRALKRLNKTDVSIVIGTTLLVGNIATFACPDDSKKRPICVVINKGRTKIRVGNWARKKGIVFDECSDVVLGALAEVLELPVEEAPTVNRQLLLEHGETALDIKRIFFGERR